MPRRVRVCPETASSSVVDVLLAAAGRIVLSRRRLKMREAVSTAKSRCREPRCTHRHFRHVRFPRSAARKRSCVRLSARRSVRRVCSRIAQRAWVRTEVKHPQADRDPARRIARFPGPARRRPPGTSAAVGTLANNNMLSIIGKLCSFLGLATTVMALSRKPVILAVPVQAWQAARAS